MLDGTFTPTARAAIYGREDGRCAGCGATAPLTTQHRTARAMGGTRRLEVGHPANGVALCGSGTTGCHGWTEHEPTLAVLLGWRLPPGADAHAAPYRSRVYGWRRVDEHGHAVYVDLDDLDDLDARVTAWHAYTTWRATGRTPTALDLALQVAGA